MCLKPCAQAHARSSSCGWSACFFSPACVQKTSSREGVFPLGVPVPPSPSRLHLDARNVHDAAADPLKAARKPTAPDRLFCALFCRRAGKVPARDATATAARRRILHRHPHWLRTRARARPGRTPRLNICVLAADSRASACIQLRLSLKTRTTIVSRRCERGDGH